MREIEALIAEQQAGAEKAGYPAKVSSPILYVIDKF